MSTQYPDGWLSFKEYVTKNLPDHDLSKIIQELYALREKVERLEAVLDGGYDEHMQAIATERDALREEKSHRTEAAIDVMRERDALRALNQKLVRGQFTQICAYCGAFEAQAPNGWEELQAHVRECSEHPLCKALKQVETLKTMTEMQSEQNTLIQQERDTLRIGLDGAKANATCIAKALGDVTEERDELRVAYKNLEGAQALLRGDISNQDKEIVALRAEIEKINTWREEDRHRRNLLTNDLHVATAERDALRSTIATMTRTEAALRHELAGLRAELDAGAWVHGRPSPLRVELDTMTKERNALRSQIHDMCHDLHLTHPAVTPEEFCGGCEKFQLEKFGRSPITDLRAEVERLTDAMSWSEAKAHEDAANLRIELAKLKKDFEKISGDSVAWCKLAADRLRAILTLEGHLSAAKSENAALKNSLFQMQEAAKALTKEREADRTERHNIINEADNR